MNNKLDSKNGRAHSDARKLHCVFFFFLLQDNLWIKLSRHAEVSLDVDADRDGVVEKNNPNKVSCDRTLLAAVAKEGPPMACKVEQF